MLVAGWYWKRTKRQAVFDAVQGHRQQLIGQCVGSGHANLNVIIAEARIQPGVFALLKQYL